MYKHGYQLLMSDTLDNKIHQYLLAREAAESAAKIVKELSDEIKTEMISKGLNRVEHNDKVMLLIQADHRVFDAYALKNLVSPSVFNRVTSVEVRSKMFDAAAAVGMIGPEVVNQVTTRIPYTQLRIGKQNGTCQAATRPSHPDAFGS